MTLRRSRPDDWPTVHDRARAAVSDQLDRLLDPAESAWLERHLADCHDCRATADAYAAQRLELQSLRDRPPAPPRDLWARTAAAIESEMAGDSAAGGGFSRRLFIPATLVATTLVVAVAFGALISSQPRHHGVSGDEGSSPGIVAVNPSQLASAEGTIGSTGPVATPLVVTAKVEVAKRDANGNLVISKQVVDRVCPKNTSEPCVTEAPIEERSVTIDQEASAVYSDEAGEQFIVVSGAETGDNGTVSVVTAAETGPSASPSNSPSALPSASPTTAPSEAPSVAATPPPSVRASAPASAGSSAEPTASIEITPSPSNPDRIEIAHGVTLVGEAAAYSKSGRWFAFTARPLDGSAGPDIYVWEVGSGSAQRLTNDGRSVFGSWFGDRLVGSAITRAAADGTGSPSPRLESQAFVLDPATTVREELPKIGSAWRPAVSPTSGRAVYWTGSLKLVDGPGYVPDEGELVIGDWDVETAEPSGSPASPEATSPGSDQPSVRHEQAIADGPIADWDARWDPAGSHLAIWIADPENPSIGRLSLFGFDSFAGSIDLKNPLLESRSAKAGFAIADGSLIWAEPSADPSTDGTVQLLAWSATGIGEIKTVTGPALVIR